MTSMLRRSPGRHGIRRLPEEDDVLHADLLARIRRASPFPAEPGPARKKLEAQTRESLRALRARKERPSAEVWRTIDERRMRHGKR